MAMVRKAAKKTKAISGEERSRFARAASSAGVVVRAGKGAIKAEYRGAIHARDAWTHTASVDMDEHFAPDEPNASRWDYGIGVKRGSEELAFWIEPHPASSTGEAKSLLAKLAWLKEKLDSPAFETLSDLTDDTRRAGYLPFHWLHSGSVQITRGSKEARALAQAGLELPSRYLKLPS
jgi:hypothetical protein